MADPSDGKARRTQPATVACKKWKFCRNMFNVARTFLARLGADLHAQSVLTNKNFCIAAQDEVCQECVVGWAPRGRGVGGCALMMHPEFR